MEESNGIRSLKNILEHKIEQRTSRHIFLLCTRRSFSVNIHVLLAFLPPTFSFGSFALAFLCKHILEVLRPPIHILRVVWVLEGAWIMQIRELLC